MSQRTVTASVALAEIRVKGPVYVQASVFLDDLSWIEAKKEDLTFYIRGAVDEGASPKFVIWRDDGLYLTPAHE